MKCILGILIDMAKTGISEKVKQFIFEYVDSVELLEVLLFIRTQNDRLWTSELLAHDLRSSANSVMTRLETLKKLNLLENNPVNPESYKYKQGTPEFEEMLNELTEIYKLKKQKIFELIFSPLKRGRHFANAFLVNPAKGNEEEDSNG